MTKIRRKCQSEISVDKWWCRYCGAYNGSWVLSIIFYASVAGAVLFAGYFFTRASCILLWKYPREFRFIFAADAHRLFHNILLHGVALCESNIRRTRNCIENMKQQNVCRFMENMYGLLRTHLHFESITTGDRK